MEAINNVFRVYNKRNFKIKEIWASPEFIKISDKVLDNNNIQFNPTPAGTTPFRLRANSVTEVTFTHQLNNDTDNSTLAANLDRPIPLGA